MLKPISLLVITLSVISATNCFNTNDRLLTYYIASDTTNWAMGPDLPNGGRASQTQGNSGWTANIPGGVWIWDLPYISDPRVDQTSYFVNEFYIPGAPVSGKYEVNGDDKIWTSINGKSVNCDILSGGWAAGNKKTCDVTPYLLPGMNVIQITVTNNGSSGAGAGSPTNFANPGGALYKLTLTARVSGN
jgi:hypothetical protein